VVNDMLEAGLLDELMNRVDGGGPTLTGENSSPSEMIKTVLERSRRRLRDGVACGTAEHPAGASPSVECDSGWAARPQPGHLS
jgi:hypothetical protein